MVSVPDNKLRPQQLWNRNYSLEFGPIKIETDEPMDDPSSTLSINFWLLWIDTRNFCANEVCLTRLTFTILSQLLGARTPLKQR